jgi:hypothetical protein
MSKSLIIIDKEDTKNKILYIRYKHNSNKFKLVYEYVKLKFIYIGWHFVEREII